MGCGKCFGFFCLAFFFFFFFLSFFSSFVCWRASKGMDIGMNNSIQFKCLCLCHPTYLPRIHAHQDHKTLLSICLSVCLKHSSCRRRGRRRRRRRRRRRIVLITQPPNQCPPFLSALLPNCPSTYLFICQPYISLFLPYLQTHLIHPSIHPSIQFHPS
ncbi:hypothetical protein BKA81DRAFT_18808 [Phyllosticta paracitricarpa]